MTKTGYQGHDKSRSLEAGTVEPNVSSAKPCRLVTIEDGGKTLRSGQSEQDRKRELFALEGWVEVDPIYGLDELKARYGGEG